ncbi:MAG: reverse transcriptase family protein [Candidatus Thiodiazotropha sp.]
MSTTNTYGPLLDQNGTNTQVNSEDGTLSASPNDQITDGVPESSDRNADKCDLITNVKTNPPSDSEIGNFVDFTFRSKGLHICNLNIRHVAPKVDELRILLAYDTSPDILGVCETFLDKNNPDSQISIDGFNFIRKDRSTIQNKKGGGLLLYFRETLNVKHRADLEISKIETIWAEVALPNSRPFLVCTVYRPPSAHSDWIDLFEEEVSIAQTTGLEYILMGDFNIDIVSCTNTKWQNLIQLFDLSQLVTEPTRITHSTSSIIDHVYTANCGNIIECFVPHYAISDHFPICFTRKVNCKISKTNHITSSYRCFKSFDETSFLTDLNNDLEHFELNRETVDEDFAAWHSIIIRNLDNHAPYKVKRVKSSRLPDWYTPEIGQARKNRDKYKRLKHWDEYKRFRNKTIKLIRNAKRKHFTDSIENTKDARTIWKHLRSVNNGSAAGTNKNLPDELIIDDERFTDSQAIATKFNEYFSSIAKILKNNCSDPLDLDLTKLNSFINNNVPNNIYFNIPYITTEQVSSYICALDPTKATGLDGVGPKIIKMAVSSLSPIIAALINKSIHSGVFPCQMKCAKVFPIFKSGAKSDPSNYRPISILPTISKIFEKHINKHLMNYLNKYNLIHENQSGFRQKHSCQTALVKLIDQWMACIDKGDIVGSLFIDFRKAFDVVDHSVLIRKLTLYKFSDTALRWFISYLSDRKQSVDSGNGLSDFAQVKSGVPQGSILGPTLFLLFINDLPLFMKYSFTDFFADDTTFHTHSKCLQTIETRLQNDTDSAKTWCEQNKMHINFDKTTCMTLATRHKLEESQGLLLKLDNHAIKNVSKQKLLGIYIDEKLTWSDHIDNLCSAISSKISLLRQLSTYVSIDTQKKFYQGYIVPLIDYGSVVWGATSSSNLLRISKLQKRAARVILRADYNTPSSAMFHELNWLPVCRRLTYNKAVLIFKALNNLTPAYITNLLKPMSETHSRSLRSSVNGTLSVPRSRTSLFDRSFSSSAPRLWNSLPSSVRNSTSLNSFKADLRTVLKTSN